MQTRFQVNLLAFVVIGFAAVFVWKSCFNCKELEDDLFIEGEEYISASFAYWREHGVIPSSLEECALPEYSDNYGPWKLVGGKWGRSGQNVAFSVGTGDYSKCGWSVSWGFNGGWDVPSDSFDKELAFLCAGKSEEVFTILCSIAAYSLEHEDLPDSFEKLSLESYSDRWSLKMYDESTGRSTGEMRPLECAPDFPSFVFRIGGWATDV